MPTFKEDLHLGHSVPTIDTEDIEDGAITEKKMADGSASTRTIQNGAVTEPKIANGAVTEPKLADWAVSTRTVRDKAISERKLADLSVSTRTMQNKSVTNSKIADSTISIGKLDNDVQTKIQQGTQRAWTPKGTFELGEKYDVNDLVYSEEDNSSYISLQANNEGHVPGVEGEEAWWMKVVDGSYANVVEEELQQLVDSISEGTQQQVEELNEALEALEAQADQSRQDIQDIVDSLAVVQTTGQSASDVMSQKAVTDELGKVEDIIPHEIDKGYFVQGGILTGSDGSDNDQESVKLIRIRSSYIPVKKGSILYIHGDGSQKVSIVSYNANKVYDSATGSTGWYFLDRYVVPQDGYIRLLVANQNDTTAILVANLAFTFDLYPVNECALKEDVKDAEAKTVNPSSLPIFPGYPSAAGTWSIDNRVRYHLVMDRTAEMDYIKVDAAENTEARYLFVTEYAIPSNGDNTHVCQGEAIHSIPAGSTSGWVEIPEDCAYIIFVHTNVETEYPPASIHVLKETDEDIEYATITNSVFVKGGVYSSGVHIGENNDEQGAKNVRLRTNTYYPVNKGDVIKLDFENFKISIIVYDNKKTYVSAGWRTERTYTCTADGYLRFLVAYKDSNTTIYPDDFEGSVSIPNQQDWRKEYSDRVPNVARPPRKGSKVTGKPLVLLTFSDIHLDGWVELKRILSFGSRYNTYLDDIISLGDLQDRGWESDIAEFRDLADDGAKNILQVIGNHDYYNSGADVWTYNTDVNVYNRFFVGDDAEHPWIENWGVTQPSNAATNGYLYWYKDYNDDAEYDASVSDVKVPRKIRLICLNTNNNGSNVDKWNATQKTWLEGVLADAKTNGYSIIVASHYKPRMTYIDCNMSDKTLQLSNDENYMNDGAVTTVQDFINDGGKFICWLCGHEHNDYVGTTSVTNTDQLVIGVSLAQCGVRTVYSVMDRVGGTKSQDLFNIIGFDTYNKHIRILRIGADLDIFMRSKKSLCINYETKQIVAQS